MEIRSIDDLPELAEPREVAQVFRCSPDYINDLCKKHEIKAGKVAGRYLIPVSSVREYWEKCLNQIEGHTYTGETTGKNGLSAGLKVGDNARKQRLSDATKNLRRNKPSDASCSTTKSQDRVIPLHAKS